MSVSSKSGRSKCRAQTKNVNRTLTALRCAALRSKQEISVADEPTHTHSLSHTPTGTCTRSGTASRVRVCHCPERDELRIAAEDADLAATRCSRKNGATARGLRPSCRKTGKQKKKDLRVLEPCLEFLRSSGEVGGERAWRVSCLIRRGGEPEDKKDLPCFRRAAARRVGKRRVASFRLRRRATVHRHAGPPLRQELRRHTKGKTGDACVLPKSDDSGRLTRRACRAETKKKGQSQGARGAPAANFRLAISLFLSDLALARAKKFKIFHLVSKHLASWPLRKSPRFASAAHALNCPAKFRSSQVFFGSLRLGSAVNAGWEPVDWGLLLLHLSASNPTRGPEQVWQPLVVACRHSIA